MKRIVSVSLGSSERNHKTELQVLGNIYSIERIGTDGSMQRAIELIRSLDGKVAAFGLGGIDLYLESRKGRYEIRDGARLCREAVISPIVDGSGLKNTLERNTIFYLRDQGLLSYQNKRVLMPSALDRFGMAEALDACGAQLLLGDLAFGLGLDLPLDSLDKLGRIAGWLAPFVCRLPFQLLYPTGREQKNRPRAFLHKYFDQVQIIAGDFHYIHRHMPQCLQDKVIITNTVTAADIEALRERGAALLVTTTPDLGGRSFGTNVIEALVVTLGLEWGIRLDVNGYETILNRLNFRPRILELRAEKQVYAVGQEMNIS